MLRGLLFLVFFTSAITAMAQNYRQGYVITQSKDTIKGDIRYQKDMRNYESCTMKTGVEVKNFSPGEILGYGFENGKFYSSAILEDEFVELLVVGEMSLYNSSKGFIVQKENDLHTLDNRQKQIEKDGITAKTEDTRWRGILIVLAGDCLENADGEVSKLVLQEESLRRFVAKYNDCGRSDYFVYKESTPLSSFTYGIQAGMMFSTINIDNNLPGTFYYLADNYNSSSPFFGLHAGLNFPKLSERLSILIDITYFQSEYYEEEISNNGREINKTSIDLQTISIPVYANYSIPLNQYAVFFQGGVNVNLNFNGSTERIRETTNNSEAIVYPAEEIFEIRSTQVGYFAGAGIERHFGSISLGLFARYNALNLLDLNIVKAKNSNISVGLKLSRR